MLNTEDAAMRILLIALLLTTSPLIPQSTAKFLQQPFGKDHPLPSPDGKYALWGDYEASQLWLEDTATRTSRPVAGLTIQTASFAWSPDSRYFAVNDREASDTETARIYNARSLTSMNLLDRLSARHPEVMRFYTGQQTADGVGPLLGGRNADHSYLRVLRWMNNTHVELQLSGHTDSSQANGKLYLVECFDLRYRVGLDGSAYKTFGTIRANLSAPMEPSIYGC